MTSNSFGKYFQFHTFGESHGPGIGVIIEGCPSDIYLNINKIQEDLNLRKPGKLHSSPRKEPDTLEILSGLYEGKTTGTPLTFWVKNQDHKPESYEQIQDIYRLGHANFTYINKYKNYDPRGGGRASARETIARVIAGSIAKQLLEKEGIFILSYLHKAGFIEIDKAPKCYDASLLKIRNSSKFFTLEKDEHFQQLFEKLSDEGDSVGGIVHVVTSNLPIGLGDPVYEKLPALLGFGMLSIPGCKGIEFGLGFSSSSCHGSFFNDTLIKNEDNLTFKTNHSGGLLGGISCGMPLDFKVCFKPTSSIKKIQTSFNLQQQEQILDYGKEARHDPCIALRAVIVVEAMTACVLIDRLIAKKINCF